MIDSIAFVIPTYRTRATLPTLIDRIDREATSMAARHEIIVVDDACPEASGEDVKARPNVHVVELAVNCGQRTAVLVGLTSAKADVVCVMDADLQDDPSSVPALLERLTAHGAQGDAVCDVVCAGRRGAHEPLVRRWQAWGFRSLRWLVTGGAVPRDAGLFHVATRPAVEAMVAVATPGDDPLVLYARSGSRIESIPTQRATRPVGDSSYVTSARLRLAFDSALTILGRPRRRAEWRSVHDVPRTEST